MQDLRATLRPALLTLAVALLATGCASSESSSGSSNQPSKRDRSFGASTQLPGGALHGTGLVSVKALPGNQELSTDTENTVTATTDLGFAVTLEDAGDSQEVQVKVTLTIQQPPAPIVQTKTVDLINPGEQKTVLFHILGQVQFATRTTVKVDIQPVPGEKNTSNNSLQFPVIFSLG